MTESIPAEQTPSEQAASAVTNANGEQSATQDPAAAEPPAVPDALDPQRAKPTDSKGWDGKLRVDRKALITNPEALSDPEYSDEDAPPVDVIEADEGGQPLADWQLF